MDTPLSVAIDCDPGVDDAVALLLAFRSPQMRVAGVTTVAGNAGLEQVTANATAVLDLAGAPADLPVAAGAAGPIAGGERVPDEPVHGPGALGGAVLPPSSRPVSDDAVGLLTRLARAQPGELVLLALGPLTNVARLVERDPEAAGMLAGIVHMGGAAFVPGNVTPAAEFNTYCDPEAARIVLGSGLPVRLVPLDVTRRAVLHGADSDLLAASDDPVTAAAGTMLRGLTDGHERRHGVRECRVHDATAVVALLEPEGFGWQRHPVDVECTGELTRGALVTDVYRRTGRPATVELALDVDPDAAVSCLLDALEGPR
ncbi:nucleoside hydrolase [Pseudonocardia nematodicida]|uniref:Nucleoside hydrolase n=1 Tax=Pseudonocardia nematodicida TaxID=1206997 RepID=A0ABV1K764_9PSEU